MRINSAILLLGLIFWCINNEVRAINYLYAHGLANNHKQAFWFTRTNPRGHNNPRALIREGRLFTFDFPDVTKNFWRLDFTQTSLAQDNEVIALAQAYNQAMKILADEKADKDMVLMGLSRGAATIINFLAIYNPKNIKAVVIESPFDHINTIIDNKIQQLSLSKIPGIKTIGNTIVNSIFMKHSRQGISPIECVGAISPNIPILFVCSKEDALIPYQSTAALYQKLKEAGHKNTYLLVLEKGRHAFALVGPNGNEYARAVHAFYKKYGLPHDQKLAALGDELLKKIE